VGIVLLIRAISFRGRPVGQDIVARFGEAGGTIGRGDKSTLMLPDPEKFISRTHAIISFQAGGFVITDQGSKNPIVLNGRAMGPGTQARLGDGDQVQVGDYMLEVKLAPSAVLSLPTAEIMGLPGSRSPKVEPQPVPRPGPTDPFADLKPVAPASAQPEPPITRLPESILPESIDDIIGPRKAGPGQARRPEPGPGGLPGAGVIDPPWAQGAVARPVPPPTVPDHGQEIHTPFVPPAARPDLLFEPKAPAPLPVIPPAAPPSAGTPPVQSGSVVAAGTAELLRALLQGAGIQESALRSLTPETMETIGKLLREAVHGTLDLLRARSLTKSEIRADMTAITPIDNNPLKFSPTVETALAHLLAPSGQGYMPPIQAMKNAFDDLRAHQLGVLAGMRAALDEVLASFAPETLAKRLSDPSVLDSLLPTNRRAKQWDLFVERYQDVATEAREDFNAAFGKAFRRAYEAQVKQLRADERRGS
jgi:type VI secretion system FHA domain protein